MTHTIPLATTSTATGATVTASAGTAAPGRTANIALWVLQVMLAAAFAMASATKFTGNPEVVEAFDRIGFGHGFMYFIAALELAGAVGLVIPILSGPAGLALAALLTGAIVTQLAVFAPITALTPAAYLIPVAIIAWGRRYQTVRLIRLVRRVTA